MVAHRVLQYSTNLLKGQWNICMDIYWHSFTVDGGAHTALQHNRASLNENRGEETGAASKGNNETARDCWAKSEDYCGLFLAIISSYTAKTPTDFIFCNKVMIQYILTVYIQIQLQLNFGVEFAEIMIIWVCILCLYLNSCWFVSPFMLNFILSIAKLMRLLLDLSCTSSTQKPSDDQATQLPSTVLH